MNNAYDQNKKLTFCAMMTALSLIIMTVGCMVPGLQAAGAAVASVTAALAIVEFDFRYGALTVIATAVISVILLPTKEVAVLYLLFFGPYTLIKNGIERLHKLWLEWICKLIFCVADTALLFFLANQVVKLFPEAIGAQFYLFLPVVTAVFIAYDIVFSKLISFIGSRTHLE